MKIVSLRRMPRERQTVSCEFVYDMTHSYVTWLIHKWLIHTWLIHMWDMTHSYEWHDSFICGTWVIRMCGMTNSYVWHDSFIRDMNHSYVWHDLFIWVTWLIHMCDMTHSYMTHSYVWLDSFIWATWLIHMRDMTHSYVTWHKRHRPWHANFHVTWLIYTWLEPFICDSCIFDSFICDMTQKAQTALSLNQRK